MKKINKGLALIFSAVMAVGVTNPISTEALSLRISNPLEAPEGYELFDDEGEFAWVSDTLEYDAFYKNNTESYETAFVIYHGHMYNFTEITVIRAELDTYNSIAEKYAVELNMDYFQLAAIADSSPATTLTATLYDMYDENGNRTKDPSVMEDKSDIIKGMCKEMYKEGCITEVEYKGIVARGLNGYYSSMSVDLNTGNGEDDLYSIEQLVSGITEYGKITYDDKAESYTIYADYFSCNKIADVLQTIYLGSTCYNTIEFLTSSSVVTTEPINILTAIQEEISCDIDASGTVEIADATAILRHYANTAAGIATASEANMDVNGDGAVGIDDATFVLTVYAELAAGLR